MENWSKPHPPGKNKTYFSIEHFILKLCKNHKTPSEYREGAFWKIFKKTNFPPFCEAPLRVK